MIDHTYPLRTRICFALSIDPLTDDVGLLEAVTKQAAEIAALKDALADAMPHVHSANAGGHDKTPWWHKCSQWRCERAYALLATPEPPTAPAPQPEPEALNEYQQAHAAVIVDGPVSATAWAAYEAAKNRNLSSREKSGRDEREGKKWAPS